MSSWGSETAARPRRVAARASRQGGDPRRVGLRHEWQLGIEVDDGADVARRGDRLEHAAHHRDVVCRGVEGLDAGARLPGIGRVRDDNPVAVAEERQPLVEGRAPGGSERRGRRGGHGRGRLRPARTGGQRGRPPDSPRGESTWPAAPKAGRVTVVSRGLHEIHVRRAGGDDRSLPPPSHDDRQGPPRGLRGRGEVRSGLGVHQALRGEGGGGAPPGNRGRGRHRDRLSRTAARPPR